MDFDIKSMKQRAKDLMKEVKPNPMLIGVIFTVAYILYEVILIGTSNHKYFGIIILLVELVYLNIRNSSKIYGLKVTREEPTRVSDVFLAFKEKPVSFILLGIMQDICYVIGMGFAFVGFFLPFYCFRMSPYIIRDEKINIFKAMGKSVKLLKGHFLELIIFDISNLGWLVLEVCTLGMAAIYVKPYLSIIYAEFYDYLKAQYSLFN